MLRYFLQILWRKCPFASGQHLEDKIVSGPLSSCRAHHCIVKCPILTISAATTFHVSWKHQEAKDPGHFLESEKSCFKVAKLSRVQKWIEYYYTASWWCVTLENVDYWLESFKCPIWRLEWLRRRGKIYIGRGSDHQKQKLFKYVLDWTVWSSALAKGNW